MTLIHSPRIVTSGLILALDAVNPKSYSGTGTTWLDLSGQGNNGTLISSPTYTSQGFVLNADSGNTQYITVSKTPFQFGTGNFSVSSWVKPVEGGSPALFGVAASVTLSRFALGFSNISGSYYFFAFVRDDAINQVNFYSPAISSNNWYNVSMTVDRASSVVLYVNGVAVNSASSSILTSNVNPQGQAGIGFVVNGSLPFLNGTISSTLVHNRALSEAEVRQNFNAFRGRYGI